MKYSACLELLFTEYHFMERIKKAKEFNFDAIEFWEWKEKDLEAIKRECERNEIGVAIFGIGQAGQMVDPDDNNTFIANAKEAINKAQYLGCRNLIATVNILQEDRSVKPLAYEITDAEKTKNIIYVLEQLEPIAEASDVVINVEPLNTVVDHRGYFLAQSKSGFDIIKEVNSKNVRLLYDIYHLHLMQEEIIADLKDNIDLIGHIHTADVPGRHEPGSGEIDYEDIYRTLKSLDFSGYIGFEYIPSKSTEESLKGVKGIFNF